MFFGSNWKYIRRVYKTNRFQPMIMNRATIVPRCLFLKRCPARLRQHFMLFQHKNYGRQLGTTLPTRRTSIKNKWDNAGY